MRFQVVTEHKETIICKELTKARSWVDAVSTRGPYIQTPPSALLHDTGRASKHPPSLWAWCWALSVQGTEGAQQNGVSSWLGCAVVHFLALLHTYWWCVRVLASVVGVVGYLGVLWLTVIPSVTLKPGPGDHLTVNLPHGSSLQLAAATSGCPRQPQLASITETDSLLARPVDCSGPGTQGPRHPMGWHHSSTCSLGTGPFFQLAFPKSSASALANIQNVLFGHLTTPIIG